MKRLIATALLGIGLLFPLSGSAADGYVTATVNLRAGPDTSYPLITVLPRWSGVAVQGCVDGYSWCDVIVGPNRGWVYAGYLEFVYESQPVYINDYGQRLGIPIVSFTLGLYWDNYYRSRPWYRDRYRWANRPPPAYRPLPPRPPGIRPPPPRPRPPATGRPPPPSNQTPPPRPRPPGSVRPPPGGSGKPPPMPATKPAPKPQTPPGGSRPAPPPAAPSNGRPPPVSVNPPPKPQTRPAPTPQGKPNPGDKNGN